MLLLSYHNCQKATSFNVTFLSSSLQLSPLFFGIFFFVSLVCFGTEQGNSCPFCDGYMENILKISLHENVFRIFYVFLVGSVPILMHNV